LPADTQEQETKAKRPKQKAAKYVVPDCHSETCNDRCTSLL